MSDDGRYWTPFQEVEPEGWLFWRPKTRDGTAWYVPAYWHEHSRSILLKSTDGYHWEKVSTIYGGERNDEVDIEFLPDGRILAAARLEGSGSIFGDPVVSILIAVAAPRIRNGRTTIVTTQATSVGMFPGYWEWFFPPRAASPASLWQRWGRFLGKTSRLCRPKSPI